MASCGYPDATVGHHHDGAYATHEPMLSCRWDVTLSATPAGDHASTPRDELKNKWIFNNSRLPIQTVPQLGLVKTGITVLHKFIPLTPKYCDGSCITTVPNPG